MHAGCVVVGEHGVLIRGESGAGKSLLGLGLIEDAGRMGMFARLVADDRTTVSVAGGRLIAKCAPAITGACELRGFGVVDLPHEPAAVVRLVVDCTPGQPARMPEVEDLFTSIHGVVVPRLPFQTGAERREAVWAALRNIDAGVTRS